MAIGYKGITIRGFDAVTTEDGFMVTTTTFKTENGGKGKFVYDAVGEHVTVEIEYRSKEVSYDLHEEILPVFKGDDGDKLYVKESHPDDGETTYRQMKTEVVNGYCLAIATWSHEEKFIVIVETESG